MPHVVMYPIMVYPMVYPVGNVVGFRMGRPM